MPLPARAFAPPSTAQKASEAFEKLYAQLKAIRASKTLTARPTPHLRTEIVGFDGELEPFNLRYYQIQGVYHLLALKRMILADDTGIGKTVEGIAAMAYLWDKHPDMKVIVICPKSAIEQWAAEIRRFTNGITPIPVTGSSQFGVLALDQRKAAYRKFLETPKSVLILNYAILIRDWNEGGFKPTRPDGKPDPKQPVVPGLLDALTQRVAKDSMVIYDECTAFKSMSTKTWETARFLSDRVDRVYGFTATLLKNNLMEGYCIYKVIKPNLFSTKKDFYDKYCYIEMKKVAGNRRIPVVLGYKNLDQFREKIDPYFLGRKKQQVSTELPTVISKEITSVLGPAEDAKYAEALQGVLELGDGSVKDFEEHRALVSLMYCQQVVDSLTLLKFRDGMSVDSEEFDLDVGEYKGYKVGELGAKEQSLIDLFEDEIAEDEKIIIYTRFESLVERLRAILSKQGIKSVRLTGKENATKRRQAQEAFQDLKSDTRVIIITDAGNEAINLQAAAALVFYDQPWSWGNVVQTIGRMVRIGSPHSGVRVYTLITERPGRAAKTIDRHVNLLLRKKRTLIEKVLGEAQVGELKLDTSGDVKELLRALQSEAGVPSRA
jgi:SNF2 family DNA or RNA helicase